MAVPRFTPFAIGVLLLVPLGLVLPVAVPAAESNTAFRFEGKGLFAVFESRDGAFRTVTTVMAARTKTGGADETRSGRPLVVVSSATWNTKRNKLRWNSWGATDAPGKFAVADDLSRGRLVARVEVYDSVKDDEFDLDIDLTWGRDGGMNEVERAFVVDAPDAPDAAIRLEGEVDGWIRPAEAEGAVLKGKRDRAPGRSDRASIRDLDSGTLTVMHP